MMNVAGILICLSTLFCAVDLQARTHSPEQPPDSIPALAGDSLLRQAPDSVSGPLPVIPRNGRKTAVKQDSIPVKADKPTVEITSDKFFAPSYMFSPSPRKAVIYSALLPGLGQIYNRKYWKLPILYAGFVGLTYGINWNNGYYRDYLVAYQHIRDDNPDTNSWHDMLPYGQRDYEKTDIPWFTEVLRKRKDHYRYYRDLCYIGMVAVYAVAIIDAYVDANLFDFEMSPDLSMRVTPAIIRDERTHNPGNSTFGMQWSFNF